jgi:hypothetical protein
MPGDAHGESTTALYISMAFGAMAAFAALAFVTVSIGAASIPIWGMALGGAAIIFRGPVGKAIGRRISGEDQPAMPPELPAEILGELDELRHRVGELEERVDFSERLLAQGGQRDAVRGSDA